MALGKVYKAQILFGFDTDTYDLLGMPQKSSPLPLGEGLGVRVKTVLRSLTGKINLSIPPYSSVPFKGKPLFEWARSGKLNAKNLPLREFNVKSIKSKGIKTVSSIGLLKYIQKNIPKVKGDFRQEKILKAWSKLLKNKIKKYQLIEINVSCGSGTYIRSIANELGKKLGTKAVLYSLERLSVGKYKFRNSIK